MALSKTMYKAFVHLTKIINFAKASPSSYTVDHITLLYKAVH